MSVVTLTDEQQRAVARRGEPLLLSAAAGSGKTSVLVERFVAAVREDGVAPSRILAITFTERAAGELRARVRARLLELGDRDAARDTEAAFVGTFHGFCARVLRAHAFAVELDPAFAILDEGLAGRLRERAFAGAVRDFLAGERSAAVDLLAAYGIERARAMIEQVYAELRSRGQRLPRLPGAPAGADAHAVRTVALLDELLHAFGRAYEQLKRARAAVDFDDLELLARQLLAEREELRNAWRERFELLMVDEFQDTNPRQLGILAALERGNLFTVGDELQSIYGFRHADVSLFRDRRERLQEVGGSLRLTHNFRSHQSLLHVINAVFSERFDAYSPLRAGEAEAERAGRAGGGEGSRQGQPLPIAAPVRAPEEPRVELLLSDVRGWEEREALAGALAAGLPHAQLWRQAEARMLAQRVAELVRSRRARAGDVVVLLRAMGDLEVFERALQLQGLRTLAAVGAFWGHPQIADLICWLRALANPLDEQGVYAALASPLGGCSLDCLALLAQAARERRQGIWQTALAVARGEGGLARGEGGLVRGEGGLALDADDRLALVSFCARLQGERAAASRHTVSQLLERALDAGGYRAHVLALDRPQRRLANVHKLLRLARRFQAGQGRDLRAFLDHVEYLERAAQLEPDAPVASSPASSAEGEGEDAEGDAVQLMSIHAAKGLEFPVVCVADLGRQPNLQTPDLLVDGARVGLRLVGLDGARSTPALDYEALCRERREREAEEEDRILYVAMTRARERLLLSGAIDFARLGGASARQGATPVSWLVPALSAELPAIAQTCDDAVHELAVGDGDGGATRIRCLFNTPATAASVLRLEGAPEGAAERASQAGEQMSFFAERAPSSIRDDDPSLIYTMATAASSRAGRSAPSPAGRPEPPEAQPLATTLSYTALSELERCGYRYYLERILGLPEQSAPASLDHEHHGLEARARGTLIHRLMELGFAWPGALAAGGSISPERVGEVAKQLGMRVGRDERQEIAELIARASSAAPAARVAAAASVRREHAFAFSVGPHAPLVTGVIDLLAREADGNQLIVDYKSDRVEPDADLAALVHAQYTVQRELYALALLLAGAARVEVVHWFLERPHEWVSARYRAADRDELQTRVQARVARAGEHTFSVSSRPHRGLCLTCPGRAGLCSWGEAETLRKIPVHEPVR